MSTLTPAQATADAKSAGFSGVGLTTIVAIAIAESGLQTDIRGHTDPRDRGIVQINSFWHPEVSDSCAFDPVCAFQQAYRISSGGSNFNEWNTFTSGAYKQYIGQAGVNVATAKSGDCPWYCNIPTGIVGLTVQAPGADCSGCNKTTDVAPLNQVAAAVANPASAVDQGLMSALLQPILSILPGIGIKIGVFLLALMLIIVGFWIIAGSGQS